jgi:hypothetical protein
MLILDASQRNKPVPPLARWWLGAGIGASLAHGLSHGSIGTGQRLASLGVDGLTA